MCFLYCLLFHQEGISHLSYKMLYVESLTMKAMHTCKLFLTFCNKPLLLFCVLLPTYANNPPKLETVEEDKVSQYKTIGRVQKQKKNLPSICNCYSPILLIPGTKHESVEEKIKHCKSTRLSLHKIHVSTIH